MSNHGRNGAFATAVVIAMALFMPSSALAAHDLVVYKAERHVDLVADEASHTVSCNPGDHALDGMWRIDHADQDDYVPALELIAGAVDVLQAEPTSGDTYTFSFVKNAIGRVQLKIFVVCLANSTSGGAHNHLFASALTQTDGTTPGFNTQVTPVVGGAGLVKTVIPTNASCPSNSRLVSPGFRADAFLDDQGVPQPTDPTAGIMRLYWSSTTDARSWTWKFENTALPPNYTMNITTTWRCLKVKVPQGAFDKHKLVFKFKNPKTFTVKKDRVSEGQYSCGSHYKAIVAGFEIADDDPGNGAGPVTDLGSYAKDGTGLLSTPPSHSAFNNVFYLGMDPRPKQRAFRFVNRHTVRDYDVILKALCINYRTT